MELYLKQQFPFWDTLHKKQQETMLANTHTKHFKKGEYVHHGTHDCTGVLLVKKGQLRTYLLSDEGKEITLYRLFEDEICVLSASCMLESIAFDVFIDAQTESEVVIVPARVFQEIAQENIYAKCFGYEKANERFSDVIWAMQQILFMRLDQRLACFLWDEKQRQQSNELCLTHEQIAMYMGSAREVVSRLLKYFVREHIVALTRGKITIIDQDALLAMCATKDA